MALQLPPPNLRKSLRMRAVLSIDRLPAKSMKRVAGQYSDHEPDGTHYERIKYFSNARSSGDVGPRFEPAAV
jgi:hypothetical protein